MPGSKRALLELRKTGLFAKRYVAEENGVVVAELSRPRWREAGEITVQGRRLRLHRQGSLKDTFALFDGNARIVEVSQPSAWRSKLAFQFDGRDFEVHSKAWYSSTLVVTTGGSIVGSIHSRGLLASGAVIDLPYGLPLALKVFLGWIAIVRWNEAAAVAAVAAA